MWSRYVLAGVLVVGPVLASPWGTVRSTAAASEKDNGYRGIWFTLGQFSEYGDKYSGGLGTYTANHVPIAYYCPAVDKTFFVYGGAKEGKRHLLNMVSYYDHVRKTVPRPTIVHDKQGVDDPHDNAALWVDGDGYLWVFISGRMRIRPGFIYRSREPYSIEDFELVSEREITYPQPRWMEGEGFLHLFTKYTKGRELYFSTSPDGRDWSPDQKFAGMGGALSDELAKGQGRVHRLQLPSRRKRRSPYEPVLRADGRPGEDVAERPRRGPGVAPVEPAQSGIGSGL